MPDAPGGDWTALGLAVGHATDVEGATGLTVVRGVEGPRRGAAAVFGRATGTRELEALDPSHVADRVDAVLLTGGSAFGVDAAAGVMRWMAERGRGFPVGVGVVPIVPAAVVFDLAPLGRADARPTPEMAYAACESATPTPIAEGAVGAGTGTTVGQIAGPGRAMKGGIGCALVRADDIVVGALAVVNALGDVRDTNGRIIAGARGEEGGFLDTRRVLAAGGPTRRFADATMTNTMRNTTLCVVATNAAPSRLELQQLARASGAALFRRITPTGTSLDGDVIFTLGAYEGPAVASIRLEALAIEALEQAIERAVRMARGRDGIPGLADSTSSSTISISR